MEEDVEPDPVDRYFGWTVIIAGALLSAFMILFEIPRMLHEDLEQSPAE